MFEDPASVVQRQFDAYNAHDAERLVAVYADEASLYEYPDKLTAQGATALRVRFAEPVIIWLRVGNASNRALREWLEPRLAGIVQLVGQGSRLIEVI